MSRSFEGALALALIAAEPELEQLVFNASVVAGWPASFLTPLAQRYLDTFDGTTRPRFNDVMAFLQADSGLDTADRRFRRLLRPHYVLDSPRMLPVAAAAQWEIPVIQTVAELADWLELSVTELDWFADLKALTQRRYCVPLRHYHYRVLTKRSGGFRLIEIPKQRLKALQRRILDVILNPVPAHPATHGFCRGRSTKTFASAHIGKQAVLRMDLLDFFPSFSGARIQALFRTLGFPETVADLLGGLATNATPADIWKRSLPGTWPHLDTSTRRAVSDLYARPHLPQGAPTSPALANLAAYRLDCRLTGLARSAGVTYTRYADDLAFSGDRDFARRAHRFSIHAAAIALEEGFQVNHRKTRLMTAGSCQQLAGIVVNQHANVPRSDFERLKAILTNCVRFGPASQNREQHPAWRAQLEGRVAYVESINAKRGLKLRALLDKIRWLTNS